MIWHYTKILMIDFGEYNYKTFSISPIVTVLLINLGQSLISDYY